MQNATDTQHGVPRQHSGYRPTRSGRVLVECVVALLLLSLTALSLAVTTRGALALGDDATLVAHAQAMSTRRVEDALTTECGRSASGIDLAPRLRVEWQQTGAAQQSYLHLDVTLNRSPISFAAATAQYSIEAGGTCP